MILKRCYHEKLAQASYLVGCAATGEAMVVDANRDVEAYLELASAAGVRVTHVTETHIHADFVSGSRELARRAGARLLLSDEGGADWRYGYAQADGARLLHEGARFEVGELVIDVLHTPGHTPEHLCFLVTDTAAADRPIGAFTGDFLFVGDVGRPDLLERAAGQVGTMEQSARTLFRSLQRFKRQPDYLQIWPGHGAGSACGKGLSSVPHSTVGYERFYNPGLTLEDEDGFADWVLTGQAEPPQYFARMKQLNRDGPPPGGSAEPELLEPAALAALLNRGSVLVDTRPADAFAEAHLPGVLNIPLNRAFPTWAGSLLPYDQEVFLISEARRVDEALSDLALIGLDRVGGWFEAGELLETARAQRNVQAVPQITARQLSERLENGEVSVIDVRDRFEWEAERLPGVRNIPLARLAERLGELPRDRAVVVHCQGGGRAAIAASLLQAAGVEEVLNLSGGFAEWAAAGLTVESGRGTTPAAV